MFDWYVSTLSVRVLTRANVPKDHFKIIQPCDTVVKYFIHMINKHFCIPQLTTENSINKRNKICKRLTNKLKLPYICHLSSYLRWDKSFGTKSLWKQKSWEEYTERFSWCADVLSSELDLCAGDWQPVFKTEDLCGQSFLKYNFFLIINFLGIVCDDSCVHFWWNLRSI